jgi:hypothetical protein
VREKERHTATYEWTRGNAGEEKKHFSYEAQMIICILIIYPLAVSAVHVMNEYFSPSSTALRLKAS